MTEQPAFFSLSHRDQRNAIELDEVTDLDAAYAYAFGTKRSGASGPDDFGRPRWHVVKGTDRPKRGLFTKWVAPVIVDADFLSLAEESGWTGASFAQADVEPGPDGSLIRAWVMRCHSVVREKAKFSRSQITHEYEGGDRFEVTGDPVDWTTWDGSDIVALHGALAVFVSQRVRDEILAARFTNVDMDPIQAARTMIGPDRFIEG